MPLCHYMKKHVTANDNESNMYVFLYIHRKCVELKQVKLIYSIVWKEHKNLQMYKIIWTELKYY